MTRTFFIGDVHGCYDELLELLDKAGVREEDHVYFVGDLINKGPKSLEVVEFVKSRPNTWSVMGNHELFYIKKSPIEPKFEEGGDQFRRIKGEIDTSMRDTYVGIKEVFHDEGLREWLISLPTVIEREKFIVVHGGLHPDHGTGTTPEVATLIRTIHGQPWYEYYRGNKTIFYGHWAAQGLRITHNTVGLDSGCCFGGHLSAYCLETGDIWQVRAHEVYETPAHWEK